jgi:hypothetical protein
VGEEAWDIQSFGDVVAAKGLRMVNQGVGPLRCGPLLIEDSAVHGSGLLHGGEEVLAGDGSFALGRLQAFEQVHLQGDVAQSVLGDERLEALAGSEGHLVAGFLESHTKGDEGLDVAAATYGKDRYVHGRLTLLRLNEIG